MCFTKRDSYRFAIRSGFTSRWEYRYGIPEFYDDDVVYCQSCFKPIKTDDWFCKECQEEIDDVIIQQYLDSLKEAAQIYTLESEVSI